MKRIRTNYILNTLSQVLRIITPFITTPYISRVLGVDNVGIFSYSYSLQSYFCLFSVLGTVAYGSREIARNRDDRAKVSRAFWEIESLRVVTSLIAVTGWAIMVAFQPENKLIFLILTTYIVASFFDISWLYSGLELFPFIVARTIIVRLLEVISIFVFVKSRSDLPIYCIIMGGGTLIGNVSLWLNLRKCVNNVSVKQLNPWRHLKDTMVFFLPSIATTIYTVLDKTLIGVITKSAYENGIYEQATKVIEIAKAITFTSLNTVLSPRSSYLYANKEYEKIKTNLVLSIEIMLAIGFGFAFGISGVADRFVPAFFGPGYDGVIILLRLLSPIIVIITISNALGDQYYSPAGLRLKSSMYLIAGAFANLVLNVLLIPKFKSAGAIVASVMAETVISLLYLVNCDGYLKFYQIIRASWKKALSGIAMLGGILILKLFIPDTVFGLIVIILFGGVSYVLSLLFLRDKAVVMVLNETLGKLRPKSGN